MLAILYTPMCVQDPVSCDYDYLTRNNPFMTMPIQPLNVLQRLRDSAVPRVQS